MNPACDMFLSIVSICPSRYFFACSSNRIEGVNFLCLFILMIDSRITVSKPSISMRMISIFLYCFSMVAIDTDGTSIDFSSV